MCFKSFIIDDAYQLIPWNREVNIENVREFFAEQYGCRLDPSECLVEREGLNEYFQAKSFENGTVTIDPNLLTLIRRLLALPDVRVFTVEDSCHEFLTV